MNSVDSGLFAFGVIGDEGDGAIGELKLTERSRGRLGDVGGRRNLKGTAVEELIRKGTIGLAGVMCSEVGDKPSVGDVLDVASTTSGAATSTSSCSLTSDWPSNSAEDVCNTGGLADTDESCLLSSGRSADICGCSTVSGVCDDDRRSSSGRGMDSSSSTRSTKKDWS